MSKKLVSFSIRSFLLVNGKKMTCQIDPQSIYKLEKSKYCSNFCGCDGELGKRSHFFDVEKLSLRLFNRFACLIASLVDASLVETLCLLRRFAC
jgi:hypothetical protein